MTNCFVNSAVEILREDNTIEFGGLGMALAGREPMLSPLNRECVAREALRIAPKIFEAEGAAAEAEARRATEAEARRAAALEPEVNPMAAQ